jgi:hypothetical protein
MRRPNRQRLRLVSDAECPRSRSLAARTTLLESSFILIEWHRRRPVLDRQWRKFAIGRVPVASLQPMRQK